MELGASSMSGKGAVLPVLGLVAVVLAAHLSLLPRVADLDAFYHLGHAAAYAEGSLLDSALPWATQSVIADHAADLWWGFHVVLLPFTLLQDPAAGIQVAGVAMTLVLALGLVWICRRHGLPGAEWWAMLALVAVPNVLFRHLMVRPHVLSLLAALVLASVLVRGRWWQALLASAALTWLHLGLFWMPAAILLAYLAVRLMGRAVPSPRAQGPGASVPVPWAVPAVAAGTVAGWLLRPNPMGAARLADIQIVELLFLKATDAPLSFAPELAALPLPELLRTSWFFAAVWTVAAVAAAWLLARGADAGPEGAGGTHGGPGTGTGPAPEERRLLALALLVSVAFLALTLTVARRALVEWTAFGTLLAAGAWSWAMPRRKNQLTVALLVGLAVHVPWGAWRHTVNVRVAAFPPDILSAAAAWLEDRAEPGDTVFHAHWDNFGPLLARNRQNRYLGGMDPVFQFAHDPGLYWEHLYLSGDLTTEYTCDAFPCARGTATDTHEAISRHFGARWVLVEPSRNPRFTEYLRSDARFRLALQTRREWVFEVLPPPPAGADGNRGAR